ncbi:MAG: 6,7-dimethyl-8-ribityllumazine synthase [Gemmatimonadota bacterium]|nr:MAG: 6,7-dimethyl-8-ribityllumazine synthase [Gemmatimonadota bacterium]
MQLKGSESHLPTPRSGAGVRVAVLVARFNSSITDELRAGCIEGLIEHGVAQADIHVGYVPGAWELPQAAITAASAARFDAIVALGCVIRGETSHFDYVAGEAASGLGAVARSIDIPLIFGVLTTDTVEQAEARAARDRGNKGRESALSALGMIDFNMDVRNK